MNIGIMGFGRIGRLLYLQSLENDNIQVTAISDLGKPDILHYLLQKESVFGNKVELDGNHLVFEESRTRIVHGVTPNDVAWDAFDVDIVVDATGKYRSKSELESHLHSGAKRVVMSSLPKDEIDRTIIMGVNENTAELADKIVSAGSSTSNALTLLCKLFDDAYGLKVANMTSIHAYTSDQPLQDTARSNFRRSRSAAENIIPNVSESPKCTENILPHLKGKIAGSALNVPVHKGSLLDLTTVFEKDVSTEHVNELLKEKSLNIPNLIQFTLDPIVSSDVFERTQSVIFDSKATVKAGNMVKTLSWYDNGYCQACRILDVIKLYASLEKGGIE